MELDILAIAAHPDDAELSCAGTLISHIAQGYKVGILDLTRGEMGTRGTPEIRKKESLAATQILGVAIRENLGLDDCLFKNDFESQLQIIKILRKYRPQMVLLNAPDDRHPDHSRAANLGYDACFYSGLRKIESSFNGTPQEEYRPQYIYHYIQDKFLAPDFVMDITPFFQTKVSAIKAYKSQFFDPLSEEPGTYISDKKYFSYIEARAMEFGHAIGVQYGEGFIKKRQLGTNSLFNFI